MELESEWVVFSRRSCHLASRHPVCTLILHTILQNRHVEDDHCEAHTDDTQGAKGFITNVLWANYWQLIISLLYFADNSMLTYQFLAEEWAGFVKDRNFLRVSHPRGMQRSTYFVSLPLRYGTPLLAANATLHWLVSQSVFVVSTTCYLANDVEDTYGTFTTVGYSSQATLICK